MTAVAVLGVFLYSMVAIVLLFVWPLYVFARGQASGTLEKASWAPPLMSLLGLGMLVGLFL